MGRVAARLLLLRRPEAPRRPAEAAVRAKRVKRRFRRSSWWRRMGSVAARLLLIRCRARRFRSGLQVVDGPETLSEPVNPLFDHQKIGQLISLPEGHSICLQMLILDSDEPSIHVQRDDQVDHRLRGPAATHVGGTLGGLRSAASTVPFSSKN